jgi:hypothetical protein
VVAMTGGALLARRNARLGRGDRRGAFRLAAFVFGNWMLLWLIGSNHVPSIAELQSLITGISASLLWAGVLWVLYIALEPYVRRRWPQTIVGWSRMIAGRLRDPIVGGEILVGTVAGVAVTVLYECRQLVRAHLGAPPGFLTEAAAVDGLRGAASTWVAHLGISMIEALVLLFVIFLFRLIARSEWGAGALYCLLIVALNNLGISHAAIGSLFNAAAAALTFYILIRYGLVALAVSLFVIAMLLSFPLTLDFSKWYAGQSLLALGTVLALAVLAFARRWRDGRCCARKCWRGEACRQLIAASLTGNCKPVQRRAIPTRAILRVSGVIDIELPSQYPRVVSAANRGDIGRRLTRRVTEVI